MSKIVCVVVTVDQAAFINEYENSNPSLIPDPDNPKRFNIGGKKLLDRVKMVAVDIDVVKDQATANLEIKVVSGDSIRWYETPLLPSAEYSLIINDIVPIKQYDQKSTWKNYMVDYGASSPDYCITKTQQVMTAYRRGGELTMFSGSTDYTEATVLSGAPKDGELSYNIDFQLIKLVKGIPTLVATYYYDPVIHVNS